MERNWRFDYLKGMACIIVILLHCPIPGIIGEGIIYGCRFSVPIFFMITGYYTESKSNDWILKKNKKLLIKLLIAEMLYGVWNFLVCVVINNRDPLNFFNEMEIIKHPVRTLLCGSLFNSIFWYIYAAIWTYILIIILRKIKLIYSNLFCIILVLVLVIAQVVGRYVLQNNLEVKEYVFLFRNALTFGLPMMLVGMLFSRYETRIREKISLAKNILILFAGVIVMAAEYIISGQYMDFHFSTLVISVSLFMFAFAYNKDNIVFKKILAFIGKSLSLWIYLDHIFINQGLRLIADRLSLTDNIIYEYMHPLLVIIFAVIMAFVIYFLKRRKKESSKPLK